MAALAVPVPRSLWEAGFLPGVGVVRKLRPATAKVLRTGRLVHREAEAGLMCADQAGRVGRGGEPIRLRVEAANRRPALVQHLALFRGRVGASVRLAA